MRWFYSGIFLVAAWISMGVSGCTKLNSGDRFTVVTDGVEFRYEVIVSKMNYVRVMPVAGPDALRGSLAIPATVTYDDVLYTVTQVGARAFQDYDGLTSVTLPSTLSVIEARAFSGCTSLEEINTPRPLSSIGDEAFAGCALLRTFNFDASLSTLGKGCFQGCASLETLDLVPSFTEIPASAFSGCTGLRTLALPATILQVGDDAFSGCTGLVQVELDRSVQRIGDRAFAGCTGIQSLTCLTAIPPTCTASTFEGVPVDIPVTVPMSTLTSYRTAIGWNHFSRFEGVY